MKPVRVEAGRSLLTVGRPNTFYVVEAGTCSVLGDLGQVDLPSTPPLSPYPFSTGRDM